MTDPSDASSSRTASSEYHPASRHHRYPAEGGVRETFESIIIAFVLAFVFRAFVVEAFVIPTGSMAPTLLGEHIRADCPQCGYEFPAGPGRTRDPVHCPMCEYPVELGGARINSGDRILVLKYIYAFTEPKRWDVVVFKAPHEPDTNYIKRLVGLPGEELRIMEGNIYTRPLTAGGQPPPEDEPWVIQRKPEDAQRAVWQPVYHSDYLPLDGGSPGGLSARRREWHIPWQPVGPTGDQWAFERRGSRWRYADPEGRPGVIGFDFNARTLRNLYSYNMLLRGGGEGQHIIEDMRIAATVMPETDGARLSMICGSRDMFLRAILEPDGRLVLQSRPRPDEEDGERNGIRKEDRASWTTRAEVEIDPLSVKRGTRVELWHVDQALSFWVDGERVAEWTYDVDVEAMARERRSSRRPVARLAVQGAPVLLRSVNLDRDLYYTQTDTYNALATHGRVATIPENRFFCLGDNSPQSKDSRLWEHVDPWVEHLTGAEIGLVPRDLMIGKAFFVYFPAPWRFSPDSMAIIPNFADMRFIE